MYNCVVRHLTDNMLVLATIELIRTQMLSGFRILGLGIPPFGGSGFRKSCV